MAGENGQRKARSAERRGKGFSRAGSLIDDQMRTIAGKRGFQEARLRALWPEIAGLDCAGISRPVKLTVSRGPAGGLLTLAVSGAHGQFDGT